MKIEYIDGLLQTSLTLTYKGQSLIVDKLVIDTGASHTLLCSDVLADIGVFFETGDEIITAFGIGGEESCFRKTFDSIQLGNINIENYKLDVGSLHEKLPINGLLGLDLLMKANIVLNLAELVMYSTKEND